MPKWRHLCLKTRFGLIGRRWYLFYCLWWQWVPDRGQYRPLFPSTSFSYRKEGAECTTGIRGTLSYITQGCRGIVSALRPDWPIVPKCASLQGMHLWYRGNSGSPKASYRWFARHPWDEKNMQDARKKEHTRDNVKINYTHFAIRLFSRTIISSHIARENPFVSCIITTSTVT